MSLRVVGVEVMLGQNGKEPHTFMGGRCILKVPRKLKVAKK